MKNESNNRSEVPVGWTTLEQSICLVSCGLEAKTADMCYEEKFDEYGAPLYEWRLVAEKSIAIEQNLFSWRQRYVEPCWSLGKLISIIRNSSKNFENVLFLKNLDKIELLLIGVPVFKGNTEVEACVKGVVWLLDKGYISKEK